MRLLKYILYIFILFSIYACVVNKTPSKPKKQENNDSYAYLGELTPAQEVIKKELIEYLKSLESFDVDDIVSKTYDKLFDVINKQHFREYITTMMNSKDIIVQKYDTNITKIGKVKSSSNGTKFCQVSYTSKAKILLLNDQLYKTETSMNYLYDVLIHKYGRENINFDVKKRTIEIKRKENMILIKQKDKPWKFIGDNPEYRRIYPKILAPELLDMLQQTTSS